jgi:hypothetical protein
MTTAHIQSKPIDSWTPSPGESEREALCRSLENGDVLFFPRLAFEILPGERRFLTDAWATESNKNISLRPGAGEVRGAQGAPEDLAALREMMARYARSASQLLDGLFPRYAAHRRPGGTSFRPCKIEGRGLGWRRDDTRMHVDSFPSNPVQGKRILRVFSNVHPAGGTRNWVVGETFPLFARRFVADAKAPLPGASLLLSGLGITKSRRSHYDHLMLQLHDLAKADAKFQRESPREEFAFPAGATWIAYTDQVVHSATSGQFALEQTSYVESAALQDRATSPLAVLEGLTRRSLV